MEEYFAYFSFFYLFIFYFQAPRCLGEKYRRNGAQNIEHVTEFLPEIVRGSGSIIVDSFAL